MKKIALSLVMALSFFLLSPTLIPSAQAASLVEEKIVELAAKNTTNGRLQELLAAKKQFDQGSKDVLWGLLAKTAMQKMAVNSPNVQPTISSNIVETELRKEVEQRIGDRLKPYQKELSVLAMLLNINNPLVPSVVKDSSSLAGAPAHYQRSIDMTATAYAPGSLDNGKWGSLNYIGGKVQKGIAAVDPKVIPMGSRLWVEGYGDAIAEDQGSAIKGNRIDLAFNSRSEALEYGIQNVKVYVLE